MNPEPTVYKIAGAILAGGRASRMGGIAKGMLRADGPAETQYLASPPQHVASVPETQHVASLLERLVVHMLRCGVEQVVIVANDSRPYAHVGCAVIPDKRLGAGPLAGIEAALTHFADEYDAVLCLPCDLPALSSKEMSELLSAFAAGGGPVTFAQTKGSVRHPLCAVVRTDVLDEVSAALDRGELGVGDLWSRLGGSPVHFDNPDSFINLNSPGDLDAWLAGKSNDARR